VTPMPVRKSTPTMALLAAAATADQIALLLRRALRAHPVLVLVVFALAMTVTLVVFTRLIVRGARHVTTRPTYPEKESMR